MQVKGKCAIITGGASGFGKELSIKLISLGGKVVIGDIDVTGGKAFVDELNKNGEVAAFVKCDVCDEAQLQQLFQVAKKFGGAQIMVNNAGIGPDENIETNSKLCAKVADINLKAVFVGTSLAIQHFDEQLAQGKKQDYSIINISSLSAFSPVKINPAYSATKLAVLYFTQTLGYLKKRGIRVNCVAPYFVETAMTSKLKDDPKFKKLVGPGFEPLKIHYVIDGIVDFIQDETIAGEGLYLSPKIQKIVPKLWISNKL